MSMIKTNKKITPKVLTCAFGLIVVLITLLSCIKKTNTNEITKTYFTISAPIFKPDASYFLHRDSVAVIDYKNYALYEFADIKTVQRDTILIERTVINRYFLLKKKELYGRYYNSLDDKIGKSMRMDSLLSKRAFYGQSISMSKTILIRTKKNQDGYKLIEKYKCESKVDLTYPDTIIIYYSNRLKDISFTLSKEMDSAKKMKVQKIRAIYNSQFIPGNPNKFPSYEYRLELKKDTISNLEKYKRFINERISKNR